MLQSGGHPAGNLPCADVSIPKPISASSTRAFWRSTVPTRERRQALASPAWPLTPQVAPILLTSVGSTIVYLRLIVYILISMPHRPCNICARVSRQLPVSKLHLCKARKMRNSHCWPSFYALLLMGCPRNRIFHFPLRSSMDCMFLDRLCLPSPLLLYEGRAGWYILHWAASQPMFLTRFKYLFREAGCNQSPVKA